LIALAADLPTSVLSDLFGISDTSALQWTHRAGRNWNTYVSATIAEKRNNQSSELASGRPANETAPRAARARAGGSKPVSGSPGLGLVEW
jgi:hypothetical protein